MDAAQKMRAAAERLIEQAENFEDGDLWNDVARDLADEILARVEQR